jgi:hypothetical protein
MGAVGATPVMPTALTLTIMLYFMWCCRYVRIGQARSYIVAPMDAASLAECKAFRLPCYDASYVYKASGGHLCLLFDACKLHAEPLGTRLTCHRC